MNSASARTAALRIQLTKRSDGTYILKCVREDGTSTWQKVEGRNAAFFPVHDLTHYCVESVLRIPDAFFGLIACGWTIEETGGKGARGSLPPNAGFVESVVGTGSTFRVRLPWRGPVESRGTAGAGHERPDEGGVPETAR